MNELIIVDEDYIAAVSPGTPPSAVVSLTSEARIRDLQWALNRALNCAPHAPAWLFELSDMIEAGLNQGDPDA